MKKNCISALFVLIFMNIVSGCINYETLSEKDTDTFINGKEFLGSETDDYDVTFIVATDLHYWQAGTDNDRKWQAAIVHTLNKIGSEDSSVPVKWPVFTHAEHGQIEFSDSDISKPVCVVLCGDLAHYGGDYEAIGGGPAYNDFKNAWMKNKDSADSVKFPVFVGLGNHDLGTEPGIVRNMFYQPQMYSLVEDYHFGKNADVPALAYDKRSRYFSWNLGGAHCVQTHLFPGSESYGIKSGEEWFKADLKLLAGNNRPVLLFQHYGYDGFSSQWELDDVQGEYRWWSDEHRSNFEKMIAGKNVACVFTGHSHYPEKRWVKNRHDGAEFLNFTCDNPIEGGFLLCRMNKRGLLVANCKLNEAESFEFCDPWEYVKF